MEYILQTKNLCKSFSTGGVMQHVLKNLDVSIEKGDFTVIMGSSGSGKSTLLYALSGMDKPTIGEICYNEEQISGYSNDRLAVFRRKNCGFVFQDILLNENMSILDNVLASAFLLKGDKKAIVKKAEDLLESVGIEKSMFKKFPSQMSGGELQRVGLVRALINDPTVLFADEPTGALNSANSQAVLDLFNRCHQQGKTIVMVTHDIKTAIRGNKILYLKDGVILSEMVLGIYDALNEKMRLDTLKSFLDKMGW